MGPRRGARKIGPIWITREVLVLLQWGRAVGRGKSEGSIINVRPEVARFNGAAPWGAENH